MRKKVVFIIGAASELGLALINKLLNQGIKNLLTLDLHPLPDDIDSAVFHVEGDFQDTSLLYRLITKYEFDVIYHLATVPLTHAEFSPEMAHHTNVNGTLKLLQLASEQSAWRRKPVQFVFPSSLAVYGLTPRELKANKVGEKDWNYPTTIYGCSLLYCEFLGRYFDQYYYQLAKERPTMIDFRCVRLPNLINVLSMPSDGINNYIFDMLYAAVSGVEYICPVRGDTRIPFMAIPDAANALMILADKPKDILKRHVYNVTGFSLSAAEVYNIVLKFFPRFHVRFEPVLEYQAILDSWPVEMDDSAARNDWGWESDYSIERTFSDYLIPNIALLA